MSDYRKRKQDAIRRARQNNPDGPLPRCRACDECGKVSADGIEFDRLSLCTACVESLQRAGGFDALTTKQQVHMNMLLSWWMKNAPAQQRDTMEADLAGFFGEDVAAALTGRHDA